MMAYRPPWKKIIIAGIFGAVLGMVFVAEPIRCYMGKTCLWRDGWR